MTTPQDDLVKRLGTIAKWLVAAPVVAPVADMVLDLHAAAARIEALEAERDEAERNERIENSGRMVERARAELAEERVQELEYERDWHETQMAEAKRNARADLQQEMAETLRNADGRADRAEAENSMLREALVIAVRMMGGFPDSHDPQQRRFCALAIVKEINAALDAELDDPRAFLDEPPAPKANAVANNLTPSKAPAESLHGPDCLVRSAEDHEVEMGRAVPVNTNPYADMYHLDLMVLKPAPAKCDRCDGTRKVRKGYNYVICPVCHGTGEAPSDPV